MRASVSVLSQFVVEKSTDHAAHGVTTVAWSMLFLLYEIVDSAV